VTFLCDQIADEVPLELINKDSNTLFFVSSALGNRLGLDC
jgi:hypothetical protein